MLSKIQLRSTTDGFLLLLHRVQGSLHSGDEREKIEGGFKLFGCRWLFIWWFLTTWITVVILELIHA